jgi:hypothetical protein
MLKPGRRPFRGRRPGVERQQFTANLRSERIGEDEYDGGILKVPREVCAFEVEPWKISCRQG